MPMLNSNKNLQINSRSLARLISNAGFRQLVNDKDCKAFGKNLKNIILKNSKKFKGNPSIKELLDFSYNYLQQDYRHEYIYKTKLLSEYILSNYSLADTIILNEFKIGNSIADMVLVNGTNKVFEIKTELDTPERLKTQVDDYYKGFSEVYIVTHFTIALKYKSIINENIGIIIFNEDNSLTTYREAIPDISRLNNNVMMKSLRKGEFLKIIKSLFGSLPHTTQVALYKECLALVETLDPVILQKYFLSTIKGRIVDGEFLIMRGPGVPDYLKFFCYIFKISEKQYLSLPARLSWEA